MRHGVVLAIGLGFAPAVGCMHENPAAKVPVVEEFTVPPDDPRYDTPPTAEYHKPTPKKEWGSKPGSMGPGAGFGGGPMGG
ncbi:MAG TPA: hypothetical protein VGJ05_01675 [Fimbriiglobus sp.]